MAWAVVKPTTLCEQFWGAFISFGQFYANQSTAVLCVICEETRIFWFMRTMLASAWLSSRPWAGDITLGVQARVVSSTPEKD